MAVAVERAKESSVGGVQPPRTEMAMVAAGGNRIA